MVALEVVGGVLQAGPEAASLIAAFHAGTLGLGFGIAGFLIPWYIGIIHTLAQQGIIQLGVTRVAGASSGGLIAVAMCSGLSTEQIRDTTLKLSAYCRANRNCQGRLEQQVRVMLRATLPPDAAARCATTAFLSISTGRLSAPRPLLASNWSSYADLLDAAAATSFIPFWSGANATTSYRGAPAFDGFLSEGDPCPPGVGYCVRVSSRNPPWSKRQMGDWYRVLARSTHTGGPPKTAPRVPASAVSLAALEKGGQQDLAAFKQAKALGIDLAPGIFHPTGIPPEAWANMVVQPPDAATNAHLFNLGAADARVWAQLTGLSAAAAAKRAGVSTQAAAARPQPKQQRVAKSG